MVIKISTRTAPTIILM